MTTGIIDVVRAFEDSASWVDSYALVPVDEGLLMGRNPSAGGIPVLLDGMSP